MSEQNFPTLTTKRRVMGDGSGATWSSSHGIWCENLACAGCGPATLSDSEIANLEWRVVEAAVKLSGEMDCECFKAWADISTARAGCELLEAVSALIAAREKVENGSPSP